MPLGIIFYFVIYLPMLKMYTTIHWINKVLLQILLSNKDIFFKLFNFKYRFSMAKIINKYHR